MLRYVRILLCICMHMPILTHGALSLDHALNDRSNTVVALPREEKEQPKKKKQSYSLKNIAGLSAAAVMVCWWYMSGSTSQSRGPLGSAIPFTSTIPVLSTPVGPGGPRYNFKSKTIEKRLWDLCTTLKGAFKTSALKLIFDKSQTLQYLECVNIRWYINNDDDVSDNALTEVRCAAIDQFWMSKDKKYTLTRNQNGVYTTYPSIETGTRCLILHMAALPGTFAAPATR